LSIGVLITFLTKDKTLCDEELPNSKFTEPTFFYSVGVLRICGLEQANKTNDKIFLNIKTLILYFFLAIKHDK